MSLTRKIRVLHVIDGFGTGGAETWLLAMCRWAAAHPESGLELQFLAAGGKSVRYDNEVLATGARIHYIRFTLGDLLGFRKAFVQLLDQEKFDVIHHHQDFVSGWYFMLGLGHLPKVRIAHLHNPLNFLKGYLSSPSRWFSYHGGRIMMAMLATAITGTSDAVMDSYGYGRWPYRSRRIAPQYCGIDMLAFRYDAEAAARVRQELGIPKAARVGLFAGRIGLDEGVGGLNQKNPEMALAVARSLVTRYPDWIMLFAGHKGKQGAEMEAAVKAEGLGERIRFLDVRKDMPALMSASDVFLFPSYWEGLGMVAVEAQANGLPVLSSDTLPREAICLSDGVQMKPLTDDAAAWADTMVGMTVPADARMERNDAMRQSPFDMDKSMATLLQVYSAS